MRGEALGVSGDTMVGGDWMVECSTLPDVTLRWMWERAERLQYFMD